MYTNGIEFGDEIVLILIVKTDIELYTDNIMMKQRPEKTQRVLLERI